MKKRIDPAAIKYWLDRYDSASKGLAAPRAFLEGIMIANQWPFNHSLDGTIIACLKAIAEADAVINEAFRREQSK